MTTSAGRHLRLAKIRSDTRAQRIAPVNRRLAAFAENFRPAHETIVWHQPVCPQALWTAEEERWEAHVRRLFQVRDALIADVGVEGWIAWKTEQRRQRNGRMRWERLQRLPMSPSR